MLQIQFDGSECSSINLSYHLSLSAIFSLLALTSLIQLIMCIHAEYLRMKKNPSVFRACRVTTQKLLYFLIFLASLLRGAYFAAPVLDAQLSVSLMSAYYPLVLTGASLIVCFWAEVFHLRQIRWDRPRFLSKSFLGFLAFNVITYSLLTAELLLVWTSGKDGGEGEGQDDAAEQYAHIFNGCYAVLMFVVVVFFLIYGVEVFFKVRGGFTVPRVPGVIASTRPAAAAADARRRKSRCRSRSRSTDNKLDEENKAGTSAEDGAAGQSSEEVILESSPNKDRAVEGENLISSGGGGARQNHVDEVEMVSFPSYFIILFTMQNIDFFQLALKGPCSSQSGSAQLRSEDINTSQLHQSRLGLLSQALMMMVTVGFLFSETLEKFWKTK